MGGMTIIQWAVLIWLATSIFMAVRIAMATATVKGMVLQILGYEPDVNEEVYNSVRKTFRFAIGIAAAVSFVVWPMLVLRNGRAVFIDGNDEQVEQVAKETFVDLITTNPDLFHVRDRWVERGHLVIQNPPSIH